MTDLQDAYKIIRGHNADVRHENLFISHCTDKPHIPSLAKMVTREEMESFINCFNLDSVCEQLVVEHHPYYAGLWGKKR